ncbi:hypothetical protein A3709_20040 [Halioglobus sp. HI00S01]|uniref:zinc-ribbon domain-containing protein n=1 Tax=Halioglobus sp. HI00S01 TaxID=1822214 RepID=UPI0007C2482F|nr:zinc-ribbon domain-containing protein [Halioglobus sp. HI00S01]KZX57917.1 hypothetical protein A3709_20040 [Halioglobus sp. HI00S01]
MSNDFKQRRADRIGDLEMLHQTLEAEFVRCIEKPDLSFDDISRGSTVVCEWRCFHGHSFEMTMKARWKGAECPTCKKSLLTQHPELVRWWDTAANGMGPETASVYDRTKRWWKCDHGHRFERSIVTTIKYGLTCKQCKALGLEINTRAARDDHNLLNDHPDIAAEWDYRKNNFRPEEHSPGSTRVAHWICERGHEWSCKISERTAERSRRSCPHCKTLKYTHPELAAELHPTKNGPITAEKLKKSSTDMVLWVCPHGHEYSQTPAARTRKLYPAGCTVCKSIGVIYEDLIAAEWDYKGNRGLDPMDITVSESISAKWVNKETGERWVETVVSRINRHRRKLKSVKKSAKRGKLKKTA